MKKERSDDLLQQKFKIQFSNYLDDKKLQNVPSKENFFFQTFYFSQNLYQRVETLKTGVELNSHDLNLGKVVQIIMKDIGLYTFSERFQTFISNLQSQNCKDKKVSFFRMIIRHLKKRILKNTYSDKSYPQIVAFQKKVSKNTISKKLVLALVKAHGKQIISYLKSDLCLKDILSVNKSKNNRAFYLLHLKDIAIDAQLDKLEDYPFYSLNSFDKNIKKMVSSFYKKIFSAEQANQDFDIKQQKDAYLSNMLEEFPACTHKNKGQTQGSIPVSECIFQHGLRFISSQDSDDSLMD